MNNYFVVNSLLLNRDGRQFCSLILGYGKDSKTEKLPKTLVVTPEM